MMIASTNPLIVYYHDGYIRMSLTDYDENSTDKNSIITNHGQETIESAKEVEKMDDDEINQETILNYETFQQYLPEDYLKK